MSIAELSQEDQTIALELLEQKKKKEAAAHAYEMEYALKIKSVYDMLEIPYGDIIKITSFELARTKIWAYAVEFRCDEEEMSAQACEYEAEHIGNFHREHNLVSKGHPIRCGVDRYNQTLSFHHETQCHHDSSRKVHSFYVNQIYICPFCGIPEEQKDKIDWDYDVITRRGSPPLRARLGNLIHGADEWCWRARRSIKKSDFYSTPIQYHRCENHKKLSRKQYLENWKTAHRFGEDDLNRKELLESIYPPPIKYSKAYYAEKRVKKVIRNRPLNKSEREFFSSLLGASKLMSLAK